MYTEHKLYILIYRSHRLICVCVCVCLICKFVRASVGRVRLKCKWHRCLCSIDSCCCPSCSSCCLCWRPAANWCLPTNRSLSAATSSTNDLAIRWCAIRATASDSCRACGPDAAALCRRNVGWAVSDTDSSFAATAATIGPMRRCAVTWSHARSSRLCECEWKINQR